MVIVYDGYYRVPVKFLHIFPFKLQLSYLYNRSTEFVNLEGFPPAAVFF